MPAVTRRKKSAAAAKRRKGGKSNKVRFVKGRVQLNVSGYSGKRLFSPSHLVRHISAAKLRLAAKHVLKKTEKPTRRKRKSGKGGKKKKKKKKKVSRRRN